MQPHNPFFPKHTMKFKVGGASFVPSVPFGKGWSSSAYNPLVPLEQTKNAVSGKGLQTNAAMAADAADSAASVPTAPQVGNANAANAESLQADQDVRRNALRNMGFLKTIYAGNTGGFKPTQ